MHDLGEAISNSKDWPPIMSWPEFADWIREPHGVVRGWVEKGLIPTVKVGRRRMVNVVALIDQLRESEQ